MKKPWFLLLIFVLLTSCSSGNTGIQSSKSAPEISEYATENKTETAQTESGVTRQTGIVQTRTIPGDISTDHSPEPSGNGLSITTTINTSSSKAALPFDDRAIISEDGKTITVHNINELFYHMGRDRHFLLDPEGNYDMDELDESLQQMDDIYSVENLVIEGIGDRQVNFYTSFDYSGVLNMLDCDQITLKNLNFGYGTTGRKQGSSSVLQFMYCDNIFIDNCTISAEGSAGLEVSRGTNLVCKDSIIYSSWGSIIELNFMDAVLFENCDLINNRFEVIKLKECKNVSMVNCNLSGVLCDYPQLVDNNANLLDKPNDGEKYFIEDQTLGSIHMENVSMQGKNVVKRIQTIHKNMTTSVELIDDAHSYQYGFEVNCQLEYASKPQESEYLSQIKAARDIIRPYTEKETIINISMKWPGLKDSGIYTTSYDALVVCDKNANLNMVMNNQINYLSVEKASEILNNWLPSYEVIAGDGALRTESAKDSIHTYFIDKEIIGEKVYYTYGVVDAGSKGIDAFDYFNVNAEDGAISTWFGEQGHIPVNSATKEQIAAVIQFMKDRGDTIPLGEKIWSYINIIKNETYISLHADSFEPTYQLVTENGKIAAIPYSEYPEGD